jgi:putative ABC transport system permease protein
MKMKRQLFYLKMVLSSLIRRRSRMLVAVLAVAIGATILSGLMTIYYELPQQLGQEFRSYGANMILMPSDDQDSMTQEEMTQAVSYIPPTLITGIAPFRYQSIRINEQPYMAAGTDLTQVQKSSPYWYVTGEWPTGANQVLVGKDIATAMRLKAGSSLKITAITDQGRFSADMIVSGVVQTGGNEESLLYMSMEDMESFLGESGVIDVVECSIQAEADVLNTIADQIDASDANVSVRVVKQVAQSEGAVLTKIQGLVYLVTIVVLVITMISVATTMMAVVAERRKEIGLRKALGATNGSIVGSFLGEAVLLGLVGGILGIILGYLFADLVSTQVFSRAITGEPWIMVTTVLASIVIAAIACLIPVRGATEVDPALVLRGE